MCNQWGGAGIKDNINVGIARIGVFLLVSEVFYVLRCQVGYVHGTSFCFSYFISFFLLDHLLFNSKEKNFKKTIWLNEGYKKRYFLLFFLLGSSYKLFFSRWSKSLLGTLPQGFVFFFVSPHEGGNRNKAFEHTFAVLGTNRAAETLLTQTGRGVCAFHHNLSPMGFIV